MQYSIIIPTFNSSKALPKALHSVLAQTCQDYEVIIADGKSQDATLEILKNFEKQFGGRLRWMSEPDTGIYDAMNKGIGLAQGDWLYFLGSDDSFFSKTILDDIRREMENSDVDVMYGTVLLGETESTYGGKFSTFKLLNQNICHQAIFFRKELFQKYGLFETKYRTLADYVFNMRWFNDPEVRRKSVDLVIARYNPNGLSFKIPDSEFLKNRDQLIMDIFPSEYTIINQLMKELQNKND